MLGQVAATAGAASTAASHLASMWMLSNGHVFTQFELFLTYACARPAPLSYGNTAGSKLAVQELIQACCSEADKAAFSTASYIWQLCMQQPTLFACNFKHASYMFRICLAVFVRKEEMWVHAAVGYEDLLVHSGGSTLHLGQHLHSS